MLGCFSMHRQPAGDMLHHGWRASSAPLSMLFSTAIYALQHCYLCPSAPLELSFSKRRNYPHNQAPDIQHFNKVADICDIQLRRQIISFKGQYLC
jgi:hypothetical protein